MSRLVLKLAILIVIVAILGSTMMDIASGSIRGLDWVSYWKYWLEMKVFVKKRLTTTISEDVII